MEVVVKFKSVLMLVCKMWLVVDLICGKNVEDVLDIFCFIKKEAVVWFDKFVFFVIVNWEDKLGGMENVDDYDFYIKIIYVDDGMMLK